MVDPSSRGLLLGLLASIALPLGLPAGLRAEVEEGAFPPSEVFRTLQLATLGCGRENEAEICRQARDQADDLLDHPRLPASCKDVLWEISQRATVASINSLERRDEIDRAGRNVTEFCRQRAQPTRTTEEGSR
jgi:hypothetical protein